MNDNWFLHYQRLKAIYLQNLLLSLRQYDRNTDNKKEDGKMKKNLELTYEEVIVLLELVLMSNAKTSDEPTARVLANLGELYIEFTGEMHLALLLQNPSHERQIVNA